MDVYKEDFTRLSFCVNSFIQIFWTLTGYIRIVILYNIIFTLIVGPTLGYYVRSWFHVLCGMCWFHYLCSIVNRWRFIGYYSCRVHTWRCGACNSGCSYFILTCGATIMPSAGIITVTSWTSSSITKFTSWNVRPNMLT